MKSLSNLLFRFKQLQRLDVARCKKTLQKKITELYLVLYIPIQIALNINDSIAFKESVNARS